MNEGTANLPVYSDPERCFKCGICYLVCPQTAELDDDVKAEFGWSAPIGVVQEVVSARAADRNIREVATDGGVVTALLDYMLASGSIDGAVTAKKTGLLNREPVIATSREELVQAAGSHFAETSHLKGMGDKYSTYVPILPVVRDFEPTRTTRLAVVGTPCQAKALRKMQSLKILPADTVHFIIGLFCMQCFAFDDLMDKGFIKKHGIEPGDIEKVNVKEDFMLRMKSGVTIRVPFEEIEDIARPACLVCRDFANAFADLSVGGLGSPDGYTTVIIRTALARSVFTRAVAQGYIELAQRSERSEEGMLALIESAAARKRDRAARKRSVLKPGPGADR
jgi:coenzyme F420 hydrogenase subunit beta